MLGPDEVALLRSVEGRVIAVERAGPDGGPGEQFFAEIQMVVDEPPTPDVFLLHVEREPDGSFTLRGVDERSAGESILLADIARIALIPGIAYD